METALWWDYRWKFCNTTSPWRCWPYIQ